MEYQEYLLRNVFSGDKGRFDKAWQQALDEGCEGAVSWKTLVNPAPIPEKPLELTLIHQPESITYNVKQISFGLFQSFFVWKL